VTCSKSGTLFVVDRYSFKEVLKAKEESKTKEFYNAFSLFLLGNLIGIGI